MIMMPGSSALTDLEPPHHHGDHDVALLLRHFVAHPQEHHHVVCVRHPHGIQVTQHIGTGDLTLPESNTYLNDRH